MGSEESQTFGALLKRYRIAAGLTQAALAERARLSVRGLSDLERGERRAPRLETINVLATALQLSTREREFFLAAARPVELHRASPPLVVVPAAAAHPGGEPAAQPAETVVPWGTLTPFAGRRRELALLQRHVGAQGPPLALLAGEPGIGKTRLMQELARYAVARGLEVLTGGCQRQGGQQPYAPLLDALDHCTQGRPALQLRGDLRGCAWLVRLLPELADGPIEPLPAGTLPAEQERRLMFGAVRRFLSNVAGPAGTLLLLDDLQWAGGDALALLATLLRSAGSIPLRVVGAYRDTEVNLDHPFGILLADLAQAGLVVQHPLGPLARDEAAPLLDALLAGVDDRESNLHEQLLQRAGGVPFFLISCAQGLRAQGVGLASVAVPWDIAQGVRQRVAALPEAAQALLGIAAVAGRRAPLGLLARVSGRPQEEVLSALEAAGRARLLVEDGAHAYRFAHDLVREAIETDLGTGRRAALHRRVATALAEDPTAEPEVLAYHYVRAGAPDSAVRHLEQAGDHAASQYAHLAAERAYREALETVDDARQPGDAARLREKLGAVLCAKGRYDIALSVLETAAMDYRAAGDEEGLRRATAQFGRACAGRGSPAEGIARIDALLVAQEGGASPGLAALYLALVWLDVACGRNAEGLAAAERAIALGEQLGDRRVLAEARGARAGTLAFLGRLEESLRAYEQSIPLAETVGDLDSLYSALESMAIFQMLRGELVLGQATVARGIAVAESLGYDEAVAFETFVRGLIHFYAGEWGPARRDGEAAVAFSRRTGTFSSWKSAFPLLGLGYLCLGEGAWDEGVAYLDECVAAATHTGSMTLQRRAQAALAEHDLWDGRPEAAHARLAPLVEQWQEDYTVVTEVLPRLAWACLELGEVGRAQELLDLALGPLRAQSYRIALVDALGVQARVAMRREHWPEALSALSEGLDLARAIPYPFGEGRLLHLMGMLHCRRQEPEPARERLSTALAIFQQLGARKDLERTEQLVIALG